MMHEKLKPFYVDQSALERRVEVECAQIFKDASAAHFEEIAAKAWDSLNYDNTNSEHFYNEMKNLRQKWTDKISEEFMDSLDKEANARYVALQTLK